MSNEQKKINMEAEYYLISTDWMIIRQLEKGIPVPQEIKDAREAARQRIVK